MEQPIPDLEEQLTKKSKAKKKKNERKGRGKRTGTSAASRRCDLCSITCNSQAQWDQHVLGQIHLLRDKPGCELRQKPMHQHHTSGGQQEQCTFIDNPAQANKFGNAHMLSIEPEGGFACVVVDIEGDLRPAGRLSLVQVATRRTAAIFDVLKCPSVLKHQVHVGSLRYTLKNPGVLKVMHDCRNDVAALSGQFNITPQSVFDTQVAYSVIKGNARHHRVGLNQLLAEYGEPGQVNSRKEEVKHEDGLWERRPLSHLLLDYAKQDVVHLLAAFDNLKREAEERGLFAEVILQSKENVLEGLAQVANAQAVRGPAPDVERTAKAFYDAICADHALLARCEDHLGFAEAFTEWKQARAAEGESMRGGQSMIKRVLMKKKWAVTKKGLMGIAFAGSRDDKTQLSKRQRVAAAAERVRSNRTQIEADKQGTVVSAVAFPETLPVGEAVTATVTVKNTGKRTVHLLRIRSLKQGGLVLPDIPDPLVLKLGDPPLQFPISVTLPSLGMFRTVVSVLLWIHPLVKFPDSLQ